MAISPYVVSFVHRHFGYCDLLGRSVINDVAGEVSSVSLATGDGSHGSLLSFYAVWGWWFCRRRF